MTFVLLPNKGAKSLPSVENSNFLPFLEENLIKFSAQVIDLAPFVVKGTKDKIPPEIKLPLNKDKKNLIKRCYNMRLMEKLDKCEMRVLS